MKGLRLKIACQGGGGVTDKNRQERGKAVNLQLWGGVEEGGICGFQRCHVSALHFPERTCQSNSVGGTTYNVLYDTTCGFMLV